MQENSNRIQFAQQSEKISIRFVAFWLHSIFCGNWCVDLKQIMYIEYYKELPTFILALFFRFSRKLCSWTCLGSWIGCSVGFGFWAGL